MLCDHEDGSPCAALPVVIHSVSVIWCGAHQAYTVRASTTSEDGGDVVLHASSVWPGGPFDGRDEVARQALAALDRLLSC